MLFYVLGVAIVGAAVGYLAWRYLPLRIDRRTAIAAGMLGGVIMGFGLRFVIGAFGAIIGAAIVIWVMHALQPRKR